MPTPAWPRGRDAVAPRPAPARSVCAATPCPPGSRAGGGDRRRDGPREDGTIDEERRHARGLVSATRTAAHR
ncbi:hypothetical protein VP95_29925, partial [Burkholderia pseudomallei]